MERNKQLVFLVPFMLFVVFLIDFDQGVSISFTDSFISLLNVFVMGVLTYFIYKVNDKAAKTNDKIAEITAVQVYNQEKRHYSKIISKTKKYIDEASVLRYMTYPYLPVTYKRRMIIEALMENDTINKHTLTFTFAPNVKDIPEFDLFTDQSNKLNGLNEKEKESVNYVENLFYNAMPNSIHALWTLKDAKKAFDLMQILSKDEDFYEFGDDAKIISDLLRKYNYVFGVEIEGLPDNKSFKELNIEQNYARLMCGTMDSVIDILSKIEKRALKKYNEMNL
ncbi:hypothetical protein GCM10008931_38980 [Oceanobacillus oncorhynchi subsp. oncorhynchi]|uniref:hypothetical protein n=1 Tax=Oceanobacillus oncorhynchi TaxID=545501 RepID=UPI0031D7C36C